MRSHHVRVGVLHAYAERPALRPHRRVLRQNEERPRDRRTDLRVGGGLCLPAGPGDEPVLQQVSRIMPRPSLRRSVGAPPKFLKQFYRFENFGGKFWKVLSTFNKRGAHEKRPGVLVCDFLHMLDYYRQVLEGTETPNRVGKLDHRFFRPRPTHAFGTRDRLARPRQSQILAHQTLVRVNKKN